VDTKPVPVIGYKLVAVTTFSGLPVVYDLVPGNTDERKTAVTALCYLFESNVLADKGFIGADWQAANYDHSGARIYTTRVAT